MKVNITTAFYRVNLLNTIIDHYEPMDIIWHPVTFQSEAIEWPDIDWIQPYIIPDNPNVSKEVIALGYYKNNAFIRSGLVNDDDYYICLDDDDMIEPEAVESIKKLDDDTIFISLKRGSNTPEVKEESRKYGTSTLIADPKNVSVGTVSKQQIVTKGKVFRRLNYLEHVHYADGILAVWLKQNFPIRYEPGLYAMFNYFEPGRWE